MEHQYTQYKQTQADNAQTLPRTGTQKTKEGITGDKPRMPRRRISRKMKPPHEEETQQHKPHRTSHRRATEGTDDESKKTAAGSKRPDER